MFQSCRAVVAPRTSRAACAIQSLEPRRMLAFSAHINFQPANVPVPRGYLADTGAVYGLHENGLRYGWSADNRGGAVDRNSSRSPDQRYDTFNTFRGAIGDAQLDWQIAVPNGSYEVHIVAGDAAPSTGNARVLSKINAENVWVTNARTKPKGGARWVEGTQTITITDHHLRLSLAAGSDSGNINFVDITPTKRNLIKHYIDGVSVNAGTSPSLAIPMMKKLGVRGVRIWSDIADWSERRIRPAYKQVRAYKAAGFVVTLLIECHHVPTAAESKAFFDWVQTVPRMRKSVDRWEIGNEPDIAKYYEGTVQQYVRQELKPAYESLHANGETVVGAATIPDGNDMQALVDAGYLNEVDYANVHPYHSDPAGQQRAINEAERIFAGRPLTSTEWNFQFVPESSPNWSSMLNEQHAFVQANLESAFYYRLVAGPGDAVAGLLNNDYTPHQPFYDTYAAWHR